MKYINILLFVFVLNVSNAQRTMVHFSNDTSWQEVVSRASKEKKLILVDCYTTWCTWCKWLDRKVFTDTAVGEFINEKFIAIQIQFDTSKNDNLFVRSWYKDAHGILKKYSLNFFPTQLVFDENGNALSKMIGVDSKAGASGYLHSLKNALHPDNQYFTLLNSYNKGNKDKALLQHLSTTSFYAGDYTFSKRILKLYLLNTAKDKLTLDKCRFIVDMSRTTKDTCFDILLNHYSAFDSVCVNPLASEKIREVIFYSEAYAFIFKGKGQAENYRYYLPEPNWTILKSNLDKKYLNFSDEVLMFAKLEFYKDQANWDKYFGILKQFVAKYRGHINANSWSQFAHIVLIHSHEKSLLEDAADWINEALVYKSDDLNRKLKNDIADAIKRL